MSNLIQTASSYMHRGLSVIPTCADKRPACAWKTFTERRMSDREIETFFRNAEGIGIVTGKVSGNLELLDFDDGGSAFEPWFCNIPEYLAKRLVVETTPSGGKHVYYRVEGGIRNEELGMKDNSTIHHSSFVTHHYSYAVPGNRKLAMKADGHVLIETRGEGGYVKCAPSKGYELICGDFLHVPSVSPLEQQIMIDAAIALDEKAEPLHRSPSPLPFASLPPPTSPLDIALDEKAEPLHRSPSPLAFASLPPPTSPLDIATMEQALMNAGWKKVRDGKEQHWERPGKDERSTSATFNGEVFYVFSSNAAPFEPNRGYSVRNVIRTLTGTVGGDLRAPRIPDTTGVSLPNECGPRGTAAPTTPRDANPHIAISGSSDQFHCQPQPSTSTSGDETSPADPGPLPESLLHIPGFVDMLAEHTLATAPYPNRTLAFAGALAMLAHLTGRNFRDPRNLRTNLYLLALADSGVGKDYPRKVNMNLAAEVGVMPTMADRFASAEGLEDALLIHPASFFQVDEVDTLFAALQEKKDSAIEKIYGALLQFATSSDTIYAMRKKAIQQTGGKAGKFDKVRARGIREPHLVLLGTAIPKYLFGALSERAMENGLLSRCLILEAGARGKAGTPHYEPFKPELLDMARSLVSHGGFEGLDLENLEAKESGEGEQRHGNFNSSPSPSTFTFSHPDPITVAETPEALARHNEVTARCEALYDAADSQAEKALWTRGAEKASRLALLYAISENVHEPLITPGAVDWAWRVVEHLTRRMLYQASVYVHDNEFDALRQKALRYLRDYGSDGALNHGALLRYMHVDADTFRRVMDTLAQSELITITQLEKGGLRYTLRHDMFVQPIPAASAQAFPSV